MYQGTLPPVSNQADWNFVRAVVDADTDAPLDLTGAAVVLEVRAQPAARSRASPVGFGAAVLCATNANGKVTFPAAGVFQAAFGRAEMRALAAGDYDVGCIITLNGTILQLIIGVLPVLDGVVTQ